EPPQPGEGQGRGVAAGRVVVEERSVEGARDALDLPLVARRIDEQHGRAGLGRRLAAAERLVEVYGRDRVRPRDEEEMRVRPRLDRRADLADELPPRD